MSISTEADEIEDHDISIISRSESVFELEEHPGATKSADEAGAKPPTGESFDSAASSSWGQPSGTSNGIITSGKMRNILFTTIIWGR